MDILEERGVKESIGVDEGQDDDDATEIISEINVWEKLCVCACKRTEINDLG